MRRPPRARNAPLLDRRSIAVALGQGLAVLAVATLAYAWALGSMPPPQARAFAFTVLVMANVGLIFTNRSHTLTVFEALRQPNRVAWIVGAAALGALAAALTIGPLARAFLFEAPGVRALAAAAGLGLGSVLLFDLLKLLRRPRAQVAAA